MTRPASMVERVARALVTSRVGAAVTSDKEWPDTVAHFRRMCAAYPDYVAGRSLVTDAFRDARAAIAALRELPDHILEQAASAAEDCHTVRCYVFNGWQAAIDAALKE